MEAIQLIGAKHPALILKQVQKAIALAEDSILETSHGEVFLIFAEQKLFIQQSQVNPPLECKVSPMKGPVEFDASKCRPLSELMWRLGYEAFEDASWDSAADGVRRDDVIQLTKLPNLTRLPKTDNSIRIALFLANRATCPMLAARVLHVEEVEVLRLYLAAKAAGYVRVVSRVVSQQQDKEAESMPPLSGLFARIIGHLKDKSVSSL